MHDFLKTFDTVDHRILVNKCRAYGLRGNAEKLISRYLKDRFQGVLVETTKSISKPVAYESSQGSVLVFFQFK